MSNEPKACQNLTDCEVLPTWTNSLGNLEVSPSNQITHSITSLGADSNLLLSYKTELVSREFRFWLDRRGSHG